MLQLRLRPRLDRIPIEVESVEPSRIRGISPSEVETLLIRHGNRSVPLAECFDVSGDPSDGCIRFVGDCSQVKWIGAGMTDGEILVEGNAGMHLGADMAGGAIHVQGDVDLWAGAEMTGGRITVMGDAGDHLGGARPGSKVGMRGGEILVQGRSGSETAARMRRGLIAVGRDSGEYTANAMVAGTVMVFGRIGRRPGAGMKRGTIMCFGMGGEPAPVLPTFRFDCRYRPQFVNVYLRHLQQLGFRVPAAAITMGEFDRHSGDLLALGKGEVLTWRAS